MPRLTVELIERVAGYLNPLGDREFMARGLKIPVIENMGILQDDYDCIDLSENEIRRLGDFPPMKRLTSLVLANNSIDRISGDVGRTLSNLKALVLTNNRIGNLGEVEQLTQLTNLEALSMIGNPVSRNAEYRAYVVYRMPWVKFVDFRRVSETERKEAAALFATDSGKALETAILEGRIVEAESTAAGETETRMKANMLTDAQKAVVRRAIQSAASREAVDDIEQMLKAGTFPFDSYATEDLHDSQEGDVTDMGGHIMAVE